MRAYVSKQWWAGFLAAPLACSAPGSSGAHSSDHARTAAFAVSAGRQCARELGALSRPNPELALGALGLERLPRGSGAGEVRARVASEIARQVVALSAAGTRAAAARDEARAAEAAAGAYAFATGLCRARDVAYALARLPRPPRTLPSGAVALELK